MGMVEEGLGWGRLFFFFFFLIVIFILRAYPLLTIYRIF